jgi:hypothetical protein
MIRATQNPEGPKKVSLLLGVTLPTIPEDDKSTKGSS